MEIGVSFFLGHPVYIYIYILENEDKLAANIYSSNCQFHGITNLQESSIATDKFTKYYIDGF